MKFDLEMPEVTSCDVLTCAFNKAEKCHAKAITIGDNVNPGCDTFLLPMRTPVINSKQVWGLVK